MDTVGIHIQSPFSINFVFHVLQEEGVQLKKYLFKTCLL